MRPYGSPRTLERRRRRAVALLAQGLSLSEVAGRVQASVASVYVFLDESDFLLMPTRRRTWAQAGHTPIIPYHYKHDRLSVLATLTV